MTKTMFGSFRKAASAVYRVITQSNVYILGFHEERGRRFVVVRGLPGTDREHVVLRDSDPRIGQVPMFELSPDAWVGKVMEIATMTSSEITTVMVETDRAAIASVGGDSPSAQATWMRPTAPPAWSPAPAGMPERPRPAPGLGRGTSPAMPEAVPRGVAYSVVVGQQTQAGNAAAAGEPEVPYPRRQVLYAENAAAFLRAIARRDRLFEDIAGDRELKERLVKALDDCADLLEQIRRRGRR
jgi:hypothetical protein